ncbi:RNA polymerase sigma factor [Mucilaginibacter sp. OK283]|jgi:RNA polymerase sigma-70 factor (ECF subfamily)|uniref:RNA polymerase sigma factor n=1 Tax=Mucilaginibacter sp. OK283 TaxID=1881049 RepID=UPI0008B734D0|nr:RNA polymerase sigma factor [Mucilaginibacter sp. OK283]SEO10369.1 RNA polymerase sigma-70 factor, ECF subfamily [Mucilaginibacter sp. OK283]
MKNQGNDQREGIQLNINFLFQKFNPFVQALALRLCGNTAEAEDAVQDAWITVFTHGHQLRQVDSFLPWLKRIVINSCHQLSRKGKRTILVDEWPESDKMIEDSVESKFERAANQDALYGILTELPLHLRETVMLRYLTGYNSYDQIAAITGVPVGTVRSRLSDSKKKLSNLWKRSDDIDSSAFKVNQYWNSYYQEICPGSYTDKNLLTDLFSHVAEDLKIVFTSGKTASGRSIFKWGMEDDLVHGSSIKTVDVCSTSGDLTVLRVAFSNSEAFPLHCPPSSYMTFLRKKNELSEIRLYHAEREVKSEFS